MVAETAQGLCYDVVNWRHFPRVVVGVVLFNTAVQMSSWASEPGRWYTGLNAFDVIFVAVYVAELAAKYLAAGPRWPPNLPLTHARRRHLFEQWVRCCDHSL